MRETLLPNEIQILIERSRYEVDEVLEQVNCGSIGLSSNPDILTKAVVACNNLFDEELWEEANVLYEKLVSLGINYTKTTKVGRSPIAMGQLAIAANRSAACYWETANTEGNLKKAEKNANQALIWAKESGDLLYSLKCYNSLAIVYLFLAQEISSEESKRILVHKAVELYQTIRLIDSQKNPDVQKDYVNIKSIILNTLGVFHTAIAESGLEPESNLEKATKYLNESRLLVKNNTPKYIEATSNLVEANLQLIRLQISRHGKITQDDISNLRSQDSEIIQLFSICSDAESLEKIFRPELQARQAHIYIILLEIISSGKLRFDISLESLDLAGLSNLRGSLWELAYALIGEAGDTSNSQQNSYNLKPLEKRLRAINLNNHQ